MLAEKQIAHINKVCEQAYKAEQKEVRKIIEAQQPFDYFAGMAELASDLPKKRKGSKMKKKAKLAPMMPMPAPTLKPGKPKPKPKAKPKGK